MEHVMRMDFTQQIGPYAIRRVALFDERDVTEEQARRRIQTGQMEFSDMAVMSESTFEQIFRSLLKKEGENKT